MGSFGADLFVRLARPIVAGTATMRRREPKDKEFFVQDWVESTLRPAYALAQQGRNSHPDYVVRKAGTSEGLEVKSLENTRRGKRDATVTPCRTDVDFNSCTVRFGCWAASLFDDASSSGKGSAGRARR